jgi:hypothetical protein
MLALAACSVQPADQSLAPTSAPSMSAPSMSASPSTEPTGPELHHVVARVIGRRDDYPDITFDAPSGWHSNGPIVVKDVEGVIGVSVWDVWRVPRDPCHWKDTLADPGRSVDDLVHALTRQRTREATEPVDVSLGGYEGTYLEWSGPEDAVVTGDAEFQGCDVEPSSGLRDFVSWFDTQTSDRYQQVAGQVDHLWILDVDGQRLVVDATYSPDVGQADRDELRQVVESIRFD